MSSNRAFARLRGPDNPPIHLEDRSRSRWKKNVRKVMLNHDYRNHYPPFVIPSTFYTIYHVHGLMSMRTIDLIMNHFERCYYYSIDTESNKQNHDLCLIQIHSIPSELPSIVILIALKHLPLSNSSLFTKIESMFRLLFRLDNTIYTWGDLRHELRSIHDYSVGQWSMDAEIVNLQNEFNDWYARALPPCEECNPVEVTTTSKQPICTCPSNYPYDDLSCKWSIQNAMIYTAGYFLDKSMTEQSWGIMLDPNHSSMSLYQLNLLIHYSIYDCFAVTYLHRSIQNKWNLNQLREADLSSLFTNTNPPRIGPVSLTNASKIQPRVSSSSLLQLQLEDISEDDDNDDDDEILLSSLSSHQRSVELVNQKPMENHVEKKVKRKVRRSDHARRRRNRKQNKKHRRYRDNHVIFRKVYYQFKINQIKKIIADADIHYAHLKLDESSNTLSIGWKNGELIDRYFDKLPGDLFDRTNYYKYRRNRH